MYNTPTVYFIYFEREPNMDIKADIKEMINKLVDKVKNDPEIAKLFKEDPIKAVEKVLGVDLPDDKVEKIVDGVKAKINIDSAASVLGKIKKLF